MKDDGILAKWTKIALDEAHLFEALDILESSYGCHIEILNNFESSYFSLYSKYIVFTYLKLGNNPFEIKDYIFRKLESNDIKNILN